MALPVELDRSMTQITVWTRGVTLAKEARDTATLLAKAGKSEGMHTQSFDNYVDLPDRIGVACKSYARISQDEIETFYEYENQHHDVIVLIEETLVKGHDYLKGANEGCVIVVNTAREPEVFLKWIEPKDKLPLVRAIATIDANSFGAGVTLTFDGTEGAADDTKIGAGIGAAIAGAAAKASGCAGLEALIAAAENPNAVQQGWEQVHILTVPQVSSSQ
jgi:Pyruvate/2-oxoacid:ferredoxin oxidoreductase gamma subunit